MKSQIKKILCLCAAVCLMVSCIVIPASADEKTYTEIKTVADLEAGTYFMSGYCPSNTNGSQHIGYHIFTGTLGTSSGKTDAQTSQYTFTNGALATTSSYKAEEVVLEAVAGKANTYKVKNTKDGKYFSVGSSNRSLALSTTPMEFVAEAHSKGGIVLKATVGSTSMYIGTGANCTSKHIRCYNSSSTLGYGLVFFKENAGGSQGGGGPTPPPVNPPFDPAGKTAAQIVEAAYELTGSETIDNATVEGTITAINTPYDSGYKNITFTISVEGSTKTIKCYRVTADPDKLTTLAGVAVGDKVTVQGNIVVYSGAPQFAQGTKMIAFEAGNVTPPAAPEDPKEIVDEAFALASGGQLPYKATLTGKVVSIDTEYSDQFKNITVTIEVEGTNAKRNLQCFRLKGADGVDASTLAVDDVITVTGDIINYSGKIQFNAGATYVMATVDNGNNNQGGGNPSTGVENFVFGAMAMAIAAAAVVVATSKKERA